MKESISNTELNKNLQTDNPPQVYDVRKKTAFDSDPRMLPNAQWQSHDEVDQWAKDIPQNTAIIVYCVHGHEVSQNAALTLRDLGFNARYLEGGIATWIEAGLSVS